MIGERSIVGQVDTWDLGVNPREVLYWYEYPVDGILSLRDMKLTQLASARPARLWQTILACPTSGFFFIQSISAILPAVSTGTCRGV